MDLTTFLTAALAEDIGPGDVTANATIPASMRATFVMRARQELVPAGLVYLEPLFAALAHYLSRHPGFALGQIPGSPAVAHIEGDPGIAQGRTGMTISTTLHAKDGKKVAANTVLATLEGPARALLSAERTALNLVQQLSGVATLTRRYVEAIAGTSAQILDTRKTIPGLRQLQKYAVCCGGGVNHRMGLYDAVLIKDNHIAVAGGVIAAVKAALTQAPQGMVIQVECDTLAQLAEAIEAGATMLLLDNMSNDQLREAVSLAKPRGVITEASGNVTLDTVRAIAETGVDRISIGRLTHSAPAVDIGLDAA